MQLHAKRGTVFVTNNVYGETHTDGLSIMSIYVHVCCLSQIRVLPLQCWLPWLACTEPPDLNPTQQTWVNTDSKLDLITDISGGPMLNWINGPVCVSVKPLDILTETLGQFSVLLLENMICSQPDPLGVFVPKPNQTINIVVSQNNNLKKQHEET